MEIKNLIEELRKGKKRKFDQTLDIIVNLKNYDVRRESLNSFASLPHSSEKRVAAFLTKKSKIVDTITEEDFDKYKNEREIKKLAKKYDGFIANAKLMGKIATKFGRILGPLGKMPSPHAGIITEENEEAIKQAYEKMKRVIRVRNKEASIKLPIGKFSMSDSELEENINAIIKFLESKLPKGKDNIKNILIKFTMTKPVRLR